LEEGPAFLFGEFIFLKLGETGDKDLQTTGEWHGE
jgi:hypothetical protein